jgi:hypothetical protein
MVRKFFLNTIIILSLIFTLSTVSAQCDSGATSACGTYTISNAGYGAVELCDTCFICGVADGVCPEDFASNETETVAERLRIQMKVDSSIKGNSADSYTTIYNTGNLACPVLGNEASCTAIETLNSEGNWVSAGISCSNSVASLPGAYRAVCTGVQKTAGCYNCPDPDCTNTIRGTAFDHITGEIIPRARISFIPTNPSSSQRVDVIFNEEGQYETTGLRGSFRVQCVRENYDVFEQEVFLTRGQNIIDCPLREARCNENECSINNVEGTPICRAFCEGQEGCIYEEPYSQTLEQNVNVASLCDGKTANSYVTLGRINETHVEAVQCCNQDPQIIFRPLFNVADSEVTDLITRDFVKILDGQQVTVKIIAYR